MAAGILTRLLAPPPLSAFTIFNQAASGGAVAQVADTDGRVVLRVSTPALASFTPMAIAMPVPAATPWSLTMSFVPAAASVNYNGSGMFLAEQSTNKFAVFGPYQTPNVSVSYGTMPSLFVATPLQVAPLVLTVPVVVKVLNNGTDLIYSWSADGSNFVPVLTAALTAAFTTGPTHIGVFALSDNGTYGAATTLTGWQFGTS